MILLNSILKSFLLEGIILQSKYDTWIKMIFYNKQQFGSNEIIFEYEVKLLIN